jgi:hypothetical protein
MWYSNLEKHLFLDIPSTSIDTLVPSFGSASKPAAQKSQPLPHPRFNLFVISETFAIKKAISRPSCEPPYTTNTSDHKEETYIYEYPFFGSARAITKLLGNRSTEGWMTEKIQRLDEMQRQVNIFSESYKLMHQIYNKYEYMDEEIA